MTPQEIFDHLEVVEPTDGTYEPRLSSWRYEFVVKLGEAIYSLPVYVPEDDADERLQEARRAVKAIADAISRKLGAL